MDSVDSLLERASSGEPDALESCGIIPTDATESDFSAVGIPVVIGEADCGFIGVIYDSRDAGVIWCSETTHDTHYEAESETTDEFHRRVDEA